MEEKFGFAACNERQSINRTLRNMEHAKTIQVLIPHDNSMYLTPGEVTRFVEEIKRAHIRGSYRSRKFAASNKRRQTRWGR